MSAPDVSAVADPARIQGFAVIHNPAPLPLGLPFGGWYVHDDADFQRRLHKATDRELLALDDEHRAFRAWMIADETPLAEYTSHRAASKDVAMSIADEMRWRFRTRVLKEESAKAGRRKTRKEQARFRVLRKSA